MRNNLIRSQAIETLKFNKQLIPDLKDKKIKEKQERLDPKYERNLYNGMGDTDNFEKIYREWATKRTLLNS